MVPIRSALGLAAALLAAGCVTADAGDLEELQAGEWRIVALGGRAVIADGGPSLLFGEEQRLSGDASCNRLMAGYRVDGTRLTIANPALTRMACEPARMEQERRLVDLLTEIRSYRIGPDGRLVLTTESGATIVARR